ncbi:LytTR family DNA-binding domain-containing protein [Marinovum sp.]|uniref:LytTR family DNA-binding domain-containing protein n=1 Tax=Marinovum sp. TaxID=2024839 RepID=UPI003A8D175D
MRETLAEIWGAIGWERKIIVFFGGVLVLTITGPFGTYDHLTLYQRLIFWVVTFTGVGFFMHVLQTTALTTERLGRLPPSLRLGLGAALAGLPGAALVIFAYEVFHPETALDQDLPRIWLLVTLVGWLVGLVEFIAWRQDSDEALPVTQRTAFHKRLPPELGDDIISISMQDHYAEVTTTLGTHLVLIRLSDAIAELKGASGLQVHRSHYVMKAHLQRMHRDGSRLRVTLSDGRDIPVSAKHAEAVRDALRARRDVITSGTDRPLTG